VSASGIGVLSRVTVASRFLEAGKAEVAAICAVTAD
jgi:hypothetical protein